MSLPGRAVQEATAVAPAKVNLVLRVDAVREDGYHDVETVLQALDLEERVTVRRSSSLSCTVTGEGADTVPVDGSNLAVAAVRLLAERLGVAPDVHVQVHKTVPVAAGLAGGSADAAAALVAAAAVWGASLPGDELAALGARLGSDVPFALAGGTSLGSGRGEQLTPVLARGSYTWVLAVASGRLATPDVYARLDALREDATARGDVPRPATSPRDALSALVGGDAVRLGRSLDNDLQAAALDLRPDLAETLDAARAAGALGAVVSGSGPTVAALVAADAAQRAAGALAASGTCRAALVCSGPAQGARLEPTGGSGSPRPRGPGPLPRPTAS